MTKKTLSLLAIACFYHCMLFAENIASFSIPGNYLEGGKVRLNATGATSFQFTVSCLRGLVGGTTDYEPANITVELVSYHPGSNGAPVMTSLGGPYTITSTDFNNTNAATKTFAAVATYTDVRNETGFALLWNSYQFPTPTLYNPDYKFVVPILNNTISFNTPYVYLNNVDVVGSTPTVNTSTYTVLWLVDGFTVNSPNYNVVSSSNTNVQLAPSSYLVSAPHTIQRQITNSYGDVSLSNALTLSVPSSSVTLNVVEDPGNTKAGNYFVPGSTINLSVSNATAGLKYVWFYYHWYSGTNVSYTLLASGTGTPMSFPLSPTRFPPPPAPPARPDLFYVFGSDGSKGTFGISLN